MGEIFEKARGLSVALFLLGHVLGVFFFSCFSEKKRPKMGMMHSTSCKNGYEPHYYDTQYKFEDEELLRRVLMKETRWRLSEAFQAIYADRTVMDSEYLAHIRDVSLHIQREALLQEGVLEENVQSALSALHNVRVTHPHLLPLTVYGQYDISKRGALREGDTLPDGGGFSLSGERASLMDHHRGRPLVIMGASLS